LTQPSDSQLIRQIRAANPAAFEVFFARYRKAIQAHIARIVREPTATEDLVQEVFLRVWTRAEQWQGSGSVKGWLYRIATNLSLNHLRLVKRRPQQPLEIPSDDDDDSPVPGWMVDASALTPEAQLEIVEQQKLLGQLINELPPEKQDVFRMVYDDEMDLHSVADALHIPEGTVKSRLYHGRKHLAMQFENANEKEVM
jgi:RNA polymerase sigma-70 factor (ECF subfamily)